MKPIHKFNNSREATLCHKCSVIISIGLTKDLYCDKCKPKQEPNYNMKQEILAEMERSETLEEASIINYKKLYEGEPLTQDVPIDAFKQGAKWQQERSYSEEDMIDFGKYLLQLSNSVMSRKFNMKMLDSETGIKLTKDLFEQFKKK
jgi:hypothetical protein